MTAKPTQAIRNDVADYLSPPGSVLNTAIANRHEAEEIRAGRQDGHELVQLVARCVVGAVVEEGVTQADRDAAAELLELNFRANGWTAKAIETGVWPVKSGKADHCDEVQAFRRHRQQHAPPSPSGYEDIVRSLATFDARNSIVHLREMARAALKKDPAR